MKLRFRDHELRTTGSRVMVSFALLGVLAILNGCWMYKFNEASIPLNAQTFSVAYFQNNATNVSPTLSNALTEALRDRFMRQTRLSQVSEEGDLAFEGEITNDVEAPAAIGADEGALMNRVTVTVQVRFNNVYDPEASFTQGKPFTAYADFRSVNQVRQDVESTLVEEIVEKLVDQIFNASVAQW